MQTTDPVVLPDHIGKYLAEAGFSITEIVVLKRMLNGDPFTLRELAKKTGKSTGVLDQAMKKLIHKTIIEKKAINGTPKYAMDSSDAIMRWMKRDMKEKWESMQRKKNDFESFVSSIQQEQNQPLIEHFEGLEGIQKAYDKLLGSGEELLQYFPFASDHDVEGSLKDHQEEFLRKRRKIGMFSRVVAHDNPQGRKYQSRDPYRFRKTVLVPEKEYSFSFDKVIAGDTVACFNFEEEKACLIHYPELAQAERYAFEVIWGLRINKDLESRPAVKMSSQDTAEPASKNLFMKFLESAPRPVRRIMKYFHLIPEEIIFNRNAIHMQFEVFSQVRVGMIHDLTRPFRERNINITHFYAYSVPPDGALYEIGFEARNVEEASYLTDELQQINGIISVSRRTISKDKTPSPETDMVEVPA